MNTQPLFTIPKTGWDNTWLVGDTVQLELGINQSKPISTNTPITEYPTMYTINKSFDFCYGHRIWNQKLPAPQVCKCRRLHEHESCVEVNLHSQKLFDGMVLDFNHLKPVKEFIDEVIDHKFFMDIDDPLLHEWLLMAKLSFEDLAYQANDYWWVDMENSGQLFTVSMTEWLCSLVIVDFVPTSENLSRWLNQQVRKMLIMPKDIEISVGITWHESAKSCASYVVHP